jgi:PIN domain nuclease of toxin-antitoxin system
MTAVLDTHAAIWFFGRAKQLSAAALRTIRGAIHGGTPLYVSVISVVEAIYLVERGRLSLEALRRLESGLADPATSIRLQVVDEEVAQAIYRVPRYIVPEMPDRIIAATALRLSLPLITRDERIIRTGIQTIW